MGLSGGCLAADDHLVPEYSIYAAAFEFSYERLLLEVLRQHRISNASVIVIPSEFSAEYVLSIQQYDKGYMLIGAYPQTSIWQTFYSLRDDQELIDYEAMAATIPVEHCSAELGALGEELVSLWHEVVMDTRYPDQPVSGRDGVSYHFSSTPLTPPVIVGRTWSPAPETRMGKLVAIVEALDDHCHTPSSETLEQIEHTIATFRRTL